MKKAIVIYLAGVFISWFMGFNLINKWNKEYNSELTYRDIGFVSVMSILSWGNAAIIGVIEISEMDFWDKPITPKQQSI